MEENYDLSDIPYTQRKSTAEEDYELEPHHRESLKEIQRLIEQDQYKDPDKIREHLEFLEGLIQKCSNILQSEKSEGMVNLSLERDFTKVKKLYNRLSSVLDKFETL